MKPFTKFLIVYVGIIVVTLVVCYFLNQSVSSNQSLPISLPAPSDIPKIFGSKGNAFISGTGAP